MGRYDDVNDDLRRVFECWGRRGTDYFARAQDEYEEAVMPLVCYSDVADPFEVEQMNLSFTEWFLFEFDLGNGMTPVERFVADFASTEPEERVRRLRQVAQTHRFSRFAIRDKDTVSGKMLLRDLRDGRERVVRAPVACRKSTWNEGTLSMRIARVEGEWIHVGLTMLYDRAPVPLGSCGHEAPTALLRGRHESYFLSFLHDVMGLGGAYSGTMRLAV